MTATKLIPLMKKQAAVPKLAMINPAIDGPTMRAPLKIELFSEMALSKSSRLAISTVKAWRAGISKPSAMPLHAAMSMIVVGEASCRSTSTPRRNAKAISKTCVTRRMFRFG